MPGYVHVTKHLAASSVPFVVNGLMMLRSVVDKGLF